MDSHAVDQVPSPRVRLSPNPQQAGKNGGYALNPHQLARRGVVLLGRLLGVDGHVITLASDLQENLAKADQASEDFKKRVDEFIRRTGIDALDPEPDPLDEVRSDAATRAPSELDLKAAGITPIIWS